MSEEIKKEKPPTPPLLRDELSGSERTSLAYLKSTPGYQVLIKLLNSACEKATADAIKTSPEEENYLQILAYRQQRARTFSELASSIFKSIDWHTKQIVISEKNQDEEAVDAVAKVFGIHTVESKSKFK